MVALRSRLYGGLVCDLGEALMGPDAHDSMGCCEDDGQDGGQDVTAYTSALIS